MQNITETVAGRQVSEDGAPELPEPLYIDKSQDHSSGNCARGDALQDKVVYNKNWNWLEGRKPGRKCTQWSHARPWFADANRVC